MCADRHVLFERAVLAFVEAIRQSRLPKAVDVKSDEEFVANVAETESVIVWTWLPAVEATITYECANHVRSTSQQPSRVQRLSTLQSTPL